MRLQKLLEVIEPQDGGTAEPEADKNADAFAELVQCLDDRSIISDNTGCQGRREKGSKYTAGTLSW